MATRLTAEDMLLVLEGSEGEVSSGEESDYEEEIVEYLPEPASYFSDAFQDRSGSDASDDEDDTDMDWEAGEDI